MYPTNAQLYFAIRDPSGTKIGEGYFSVQQNGNGSTFGSDVPFTAPSGQVVLELEISDRSMVGDVLAKSVVSLSFVPPAPTQQSMTIDTPTADTMVGRRFTSTGRTTVMPSGGKLAYGVLDENNQLIGQGDMTVTPNGSGSTCNTDLPSGGANEPTERS